jgi:hypothetical protein
MAQDRIIAGRHADALHHAFAWPTPNAMTEKMNEFLGSLGSMRLWRDCPELGGISYSPAGG